MSLENFNTWVEFHEEEIAHVSSLMQEPLPDEPHALVLSLEAIEAWNSRVQFLLAEANSWLSHISFELMPEKRGKIEFERKLELNAAVAIVKKEKEKLEGLCDAIKTRITLGQSVLRYFVATQQPIVKQTTKSYGEE